MQYIQQIGIINRKFLLMALAAFSSFCHAQHSTIETSDIKRFWEAYDRLNGAKSKEDSIKIIQQNYLNRASSGLKKFIAVRDLKDEEYVKRLGLYPEFWKSVRPLTEEIQHRTKEINNVLDELAVHLPGFEHPDVCFAIGVMRTGGTTSKNLILVGAELAASDATVVKSELGAWHRSVIGNTGDIVAMIAHEGVHTRQRGFPLHEIFSLLRHKKLRLLNMAIVEGSADFVTRKFMNLNINEPLYHYAQQREVKLWGEFMTTVKTSPFDYSLWLYNGVSPDGRPADLGYYIGYKISEAYYEQATNKERALKILMKRGRYKYVFRKSGLGGKG
jgi:hypothetical protein